MSGLLLFLLGCFKFTKWMFVITRIKYLFQSTPFKISKYTYYCHIFIHLLLTVFIGTHLIIHDKPTIYHASDNHKYKFCHFASNNELLYSLLVFECFCTTVINTCLLYLLYAKTKKLDEYQQTQNNLSSHFTETNNLISIKIMKRCIFCEISFFILQWIVLSIYVLYKIQFLFTLIGIFQCVVILVTFDIKFKCCNINIINQNNNQGNIILEQHMQRKEYARKTMAAYYAAPNRKNDRKKGTTKIELQIELQMRGKQQ
eukprot:108387_1